MNTVITTQAVKGSIKKAGLALGRNHSSQTGWITEAVDNNNTLALTIAGRIHTPAEAVRLTFNCCGYKFATANRDAQLPTVIATLEAKGLTVQQIDNTQVWLVTASN